MLDNSAGFITVVWVVSNSTRMINKPVKPFNFGFQLLEGHGLYSAFALTFFW